MQTDDEIKRLGEDLEALKASHEKLGSGCVRTAGLMLDLFSSRLSSNSIISGLVAASSKNNEQIQNALLVLKRQSAELSAVPDLAESVTNALSAISRNTNAIEDLLTAISRQGEQLDAIDRSCGGAE